MPPSRGSWSAWLGFDANRGHVKVALGTDNTNCAPTRGVFVDLGGTALSATGVGHERSPASLTPGPIGMTPLSL